MAPAVTRTLHGLRARLSYTNVVVASISSYYAIYESIHLDRDLRRLSDPKTIALTRTMDRKVGKLHELIEAAASGSRKWKTVINYLDTHAFNDTDATPVGFPSPLPSRAVPSDKLRPELWYDHETGESAVRLAVKKGAPTDVIAALCHFGPEALGVPDPKGRIPLHWATMMAPSKEWDKTLSVLVHAHPLGLLQRDNGGRTPLHYLFWFHAPLRAAKVVRLYCRALPKGHFFNLQQRSDSNRQYPLPQIPNPGTSVPPNAAIVHDAQHGCLPLHYAVAQGASTEAIAVLLEAYPLAKSLGDRYGRSPLVWYIGGPYLVSDPVTHVSGEEMDPTAKPVWEFPMDSIVLQQLLNSRVTRTADSLGRYPLHWMAHRLSMQHFHGFEVNMVGAQLILDHFAGQMTCRDVQGKTPVLVFIDAYIEQQEKSWKGRHENMDLVGGGPAAFCPPMALMRMFLCHPDNKASPASVEDKEGRLPLHAAMGAVASKQVVDLLVELHPQSLVHTTEEGFVSPLHAAFSRKYAGPLHSVGTISSLLKSYPAGQHGSMVDGRLAMKMEDATGAYPIHYACRNGACLQVIQLMSDAFEKTATLYQTDFGLPMHALLSEELLTAMTVMSPDDLEADTKKDIEIAKQKMKVLVKPVIAEPSKLKIMGSQFGMLPLHIGLLFQAVDYRVLLRMLEMYPDGAMQYSSHDKHCFSPIDVHECVKKTWDGAPEDWHRIRELLFAFGPTVESHRHRQELLASCARIVIGEVTGLGSYHVEAAKAVGAYPPDLEISHTLSQVEAPHVSRPGRIYDGVSHVKIQTTRKPFRSPVAFREESETEVVDNLQSPRKGPSHFDEEGADFDAADFLPDDASNVSTEISQGKDLDWSVHGTDVDGESLVNETRHSKGATAIETAQEEDADPFETARMKLDEEEKKESEDDNVSPPELGDTAATPKLSNATTRLFFDERYDRPEYFSEVGMRMWTFFVLYLDINNPSDNYCPQVSDIFEEVGYSIVERLVSVTLPPYARHYLVDGDRISPDFLRKQTFRDIASPKCRELIHKACYFVGKYDFSCGDSKDLLVSRTFDGSSVTINAHEWMFKTETETDAMKPGVSEASIWKSGEVPAPVGSTFQSSRRKVWIKFTKSRVEYDNELRGRARLSTCSNVSVSPHLLLLDHYDATDTLKKINRSFKQDSTDGRFAKLRLFAEGCSKDDLSLKLQEYPFALVFMASPYGSLADYYKRYGIDSLSEVKETCLQIAKALKHLHDGGLLHTNLSMASVVLHDDSTSKENKLWTIGDLAFCAPFMDSDRFLGRVGPDGVPLYCTGTLPPEMFYRISSDEMKAFNRYWNAVERIYDVSIDRSAIEPFVDPVSGDMFVVKCYYEQSMEQSSVDYESLPSLPYDLVRASESADMWALGQILLYLLRGQPLFPTSVRSGMLLDYRSIASWDGSALAGIVYGHVDDVLAQDLLLRVLGTVEDRSTLSMKTILAHPFFDANVSSATVSSIRERRKIHATAHFRALQKKRQDEEKAQWIESLSTKIQTWNLQLLRQVHPSPSSIVEAITKGRTSLEIPYTYALLPYRLVANEAGLLTPSDRRSIDAAEVYGQRLLDLCKACQLAATIRLASAQDKKPTWKTQSLKDMGVDTNALGDILEEYTKISAAHIEVARDSPLSIAVKLIKTKVDAILSMLQGGHMFLYLVDEYRCVPVSNGSSPIDISDERTEDVLRKAIVFMHLTCLYGRKVHGVTGGLTKLLFEAAHPHIPISWTKAAEGLNENLSKEAMMLELHVLHTAMKESSASLPFTGVSEPFLSRGDIDFFREFIFFVDKKRQLGNLRRVEFNGQDCVRTPATSVQEVVQEAQMVTLDEVIERVAADTTSPEEPAEEIATPEQPDWASEVVSRVQSSVAGTISSPNKTITEDDTEASVDDMSTTSSKLAISTMALLHERFGSQDSS